MKSIIYSLTAVLLAAVFSSCESSNPYDQTVFRLEEGPRSSESGGRSRYGYGSAQEERNEARRRRTASREKPSPATTSRGETRTLGNNRKKDERKVVESEDKPVRDDAGESEDRKEMADSSGSEDNLSTDTPVEETEASSGSGSDTASTAPTSNGSRPYANPVPGKYGHVYSPFASGREVDVTGFPPGTEVKCPYTQNIFRVP